MLIVGFGCSFTVGDGVAPKDNWLSLLAKTYNCECINLALSANSNFGIAQTFANFINYERHMYNNIAVVVGWTEVDRMSWWNEDTFHWVHSLMISSKKSNIYTQSHKEWLLHGQGGEASGNQALTDSSKLLVNSVCSANNIPIVQLNSLGTHHTYHKYPNYYLPDKNTRDYLTKCDYIGNGRHPNEQGHKNIADRLINFTKQYKIF